jgi:predicted XRE-type DNA-binding protein
MKRSPHRAVVALKLELMAAIDRGLRRRHRTLLAATNATGIEVPAFSKIRHGDHQRFSLAKLIEIADRLGLDIRISVVLDE